MKIFLIGMLLLGSFTEAMQPQFGKAAHSDAEDTEELPQEVESLWQRFNEIKVYHRQVFSVVVDQYDSNIIFLRIKALLSEVKTIETRIGTEPIPQERKDYILANLHKLHVKLKYYPL